METTRTRTRHEHWCLDAHRKNPTQVAPDARCVERGSNLACSTVTLTARQERRFKSHPGQVKVTWSNGGMTWEDEF